MPPTGHCRARWGAGNWRLQGEGEHNPCGGKHYLQHGIDEQEVVRRLPAAQILGHLEWLFALLHTFRESRGWGWAGRHRGAGGLGHLGRRQEQSELIRAARASGLELRTLCGSSSPTQ